MISIMLIRHGETEWNVKEIFRGRVDIDLSQRGVEQARRLGEYLADERILAIYSSPLKRAVRTAEAIAEHHNLNIRIAPELMDLDFGEWQGLSHEEVKRRYRELYEKWLKSPHLVRMPGGESLEDVRERALRLIDKVTVEFGKAEGAVALVSHRVVNKVLICALLGLDNSRFWNVKIDTCGITTFAYEDGRFVLVKHNDTSFLRGLEGGTTADF
ncbi:histidine phosphatase family protein [Candidatus Poribacteria bacterium]|nr:MAG: histidine phosphatase family protein [Candidatus Poribacteria bacterium]